MELSTNQRIFSQLAIWLGLWLFIPLIITGGNPPMEIFPRSFTTFLCIFIIINLNVRVLFPRFYLKNSLGKYITLGLIIAILLSIIRISILTYFGSMNEMPPKPSFISERAIEIIRYLGGSIPMIIALFGSTMYEISIIANKSFKETAQLKAEKLEAELKFLKSQINPHFLFNSLNNIYTLTHLNPKSAGDSLLKLSAMLRYLLYECDAEKVTIGQELTYLKNYIDLFSLKDDEALNITVDTEDVDKEVMIAPLLLIPFVENAFKHSQIEDLENGWIHVALLGDEEQIYFEIKNSVPTVAFAKDEVGGIGLQNVKRQLELIYPNQHLLDIKNENETFQVSLTLYLKK